MARPRRTSPVVTRVIGAALPIDDADRMADVCARAGTTQSDVVRAAIYAFMAEHADYNANQEVLPLRQAG